MILYFVPSKVRSKVPSFVRKYFRTKVRSAFYTYTTCRPSSFLRLFFETSSLRSGLRLSWAILRNIDPHYLPTWSQDSSHDWSLTIRLQDKQPTTMVNYVKKAEEITRAFLLFLNSYSSKSEGNSLNLGKMHSLDYVEQLEMMFARNGTTLYIDFQHVVEWVRAYLSVHTKHFELYEPWSPVALFLDNFFLPGLIILLHKMS